MQSTECSQEEVREHFQFPILGDSPFILLMIDYNICDCLQRAPQPSDARGEDEQEKAEEPSGSTDGQRPQEGEGESTGGRGGYRHTLFRPQICAWVVALVFVRTLTLFLHL